MPDLTLYTTYKNYSSWLLRAWLVMRAFDIPFEEVPVPMMDDCHMPGMMGGSRTGKVPCLFDLVSFTAACISPCWRRRYWNRNI